MDVPLKPSTAQSWLLASRPKTLYAAVTPVLVGTAIAFHAGSFRLFPALAALLAAVFIQIGTNLANDVADFSKGADNSARLGPTRVTQAGYLTPRQVLGGMWVAFGLAAALGVYLYLVAGWPVLAIGVLSIAAGIAYTAGPFPLGYHGFGDLAVFLFFGLGAVNGTYYVQALSLSSPAVWASIPIGLLATAIIVVNNLRDLQTDAAAGKTTLAVRLGRRGTQVEFILILAVAFTIPPLMWFFEIGSAWLLLPLVTIPLAYRTVREILTAEGAALNRSLAGTSRLELLFGALLALGFLLS
jgi:1,4-dihydroxy-2-naphthoate octaprenyltransferase